MDINEINDVVNLYGTEKSSPKILDILHKINLTNIKVIKNITF